MSTTPEFAGIEIELTNSNLTALVDEDDEWATGRRWFLSQSGYAQRHWADLGEAHFLHQQIVDRMGIPRPLPYEVDHINRDTLDNRRRNLRVVTRAVNARNRGPGRDTARRVHVESI